MEVTGKLVPVEFELKLIVQLVKSHLPVSVCLSVNQVTHIKTTTLQPLVILHTNPQTFLHGHSPSISPENLPLPKHLSFV